MATAINYQSQLPQLLTQLLGSKQTTSSTSTANTTPLEQLFTAAMGASSAGTPEMQQLIASIFQEGATKVPELTQAFANATGSRTTGNSGLALSLGDLNRKLSTDAAVAVLNNQNTNRQIAGNAASGIAQATRGTTQTQTTKAGVNPLFLALGGSAINKLDKMKGLDWLKSASGGMAPVSDAVPTMVNEVSFPEFEQPFADMSGIDIGGDYGLFDNVGVDAVAGLGNIEFDGLDFGPDPMGIDFGFDLDFGSGADFGSIDLGSFLADGGRVGRRMMPRGYADGGAVTPQQRNRNYLGTATRSAPQTRASNFSQARRQQRELGTNSVDDSNIGAGDATSVPGVVGTPSQNNAAALGFVTAMMAPAIGIPGLASLANTVTGGKSLPSMALSNLLAMLGLTGGNNTGFVGDAEEGGMSVPGVPGSIGMSSTPAMQAQDSLASIGIGGVSSGAAGGTGPGGAGGSGSGVGADGSASSGADGDSGVGSTGAYANGGKVKGPGTGTSDSIPARLSDGEYVIPADVVRRLGTDTLDRLISGHMPAGFGMDEDD